MPAFLARRYDDPAEVESRDGTPVAFMWKGRRYIVRAVLAHWWETGPWWETADLAAPAEAGTGGVVADDEREMWRVEAVTPGMRYPRSGSDCWVAGGEADVVAVVELCLSWVSGRWTVVAVLD